MTLIQDINNAIYVDDIYRKLQVENKKNQRRYRSTKKLK